MNGKARAQPTKKFFVRMLTRDISLDDAILDLVDNSVDGAWRQAGQSPATLVLDEALAEHSVRIAFSRERFEIVDNCGGISFDDAVKYAFTFGREDEQGGGEFSVGVYGIGMKRAVFKLGKSISIVSTYQGERDLTAFKVPIDVDEWLSQHEGPWDFDIEAHEPAVEAGVTIQVSELLEESSSRLGDPTFSSHMLEILRRDYMIPLMRGINFSVNGVPVLGTQIALLENESFKPLRLAYDDDGVHVEIIAGMVSRPPEDRDPDETRNATDPSGWYVVCNGRVVLDADTTPVTGWGDGLPKWHRQYSGFFGMVLFSARDAELLPMTTTKRSVDASSAVYRRAVARMQVPTRAWIDYTNMKKNQPEAFASLEAGLEPLQLHEVHEAPTIMLPLPSNSKPTERMANINYAVAQSRLRRLASQFDGITMSYRDVGLKSFEYAYDNLVDEEDDS